ncbi:MAG: hypothetical protein HIU83_16955 [Proteobacteria bacterium]|nr:hypothetical protein [Pseudomonadota bacterium]
MKERDIQNYLYSNPEVLFPSGNITEKASEYSIHGKRIDLLFVVDGVRYIVEIKNVPIQREHIGQVVEYYGLMRQYMKDANLAMILVSSSIPEWRAAYLEELGIRCVEIPDVPTTDEEVKRICKETISYSKKVKQKIEVESALGDDESVSFEDIAPPVNPKGMAFARRMLTESLEPIREIFNEYDIFPFGITRTHSFDIDLEHDPIRKYGVVEFTHGGIWWAYRFGFSENMPKNDVPNISIIANTTGLDVTINAELQRSQKVLFKRIQANLAEFNRLLDNHGGLWLKTYLKYEHQPQSYHWILSDMMSPGEFDGDEIIKIRHKHEKVFNEERELWIQKIISGNIEITEAKKNHLEKQNKRLNLAIRLVEPFQIDSDIWTLKPEKQVNEIVGAVQRLKPLIDFFLRKEK